MAVDCIHAGTVDQPDVDVLRSLADPAPFGREGETVLDETVRRGLQIAGSRISLSGLRWTPDASEAAQVNVKARSRERANPIVKLNQDVQALAPPGWLVRMELYKLHIYEPGGHFDTHVDTQHGPAHIGTALLVLGSPFEGGDFVLEHGPLEVAAPKEEQHCQFNLRPIPAAQNVDDDERRSTTLHGLAFYNDIPHRVLPVTSGVRVVLQFDLFAEPWINYRNAGTLPPPTPDSDEDVDEGSDSDAESSDPSSKRRKVASPGYSIDHLCHGRERRWMRRRADSWPVGEEDLSWLSANARLLQPAAVQRFVAAMHAECAEPDPLTAAGKSALVGFLLQRKYSAASLAAGILKKGDRILVDALREAGLHVDVVSAVVVHRDWDPNGDNEGDVEAFIFPFDAAHIASYAKREYVRGDPHVRVIATVDDPRFQHLREVAYNAFTGNEAAPANNMYLAAVGIVHSGALRTE